MAPSSASPMKVTTAFCLNLRLPFVRVKVHVQRTSCVAFQTIVLSLGRLFASFVMY